MNEIYVKKSDGAWRKCTKWHGARDYENPEALYFGCVMYQIGQEQGMARKNKGQWITKEEFKQLKSQKGAI